MNLVPVDKRVAVLASIAEGMSIRSTERVTGVQKKTITRLLVDIGIACAEYQDKVFRHLTLKRLEVDEIWGYCYAKQKNVPQDKRGRFGYGDVWCFTAIDAASKLIPCWLIGQRTLNHASRFMCDLASRLANRIQLTSDGHKMYVQAVEDAFGGDVDFAQLQKIYAASPEGETRYSPAICLGCTRKTIVGDPDPSLVSTSYVERANLTIRMRNRRMGRLTNGFSKKLENHAASMAFFFMVYNFVRRHQTTRVTPAMAAGVTSRLWNLRDVLGLIDERARQAA